MKLNFFNLFSAFIVCLYEDPVVPEQVNKETFKIP